MAFELDSIFYTETMVKILQTQGHVQHASKICEEILKKEPSRLHLRELLEQLKTSPFRSFNTARVEAPLAVEEEGEEEDETTEPGLAVKELVEENSMALTEAEQEIVPLTVALNPREEKLRKLHQLLDKIISKQAVSAENSNAVPSLEISGSEEI